jgi:hypothetical protein
MMTVGHDEFIDRSHQTTIITALAHALFATDRYLWHEERRIFCSVN